jgi:hypothetical protein
LKIRWILFELLTVEVFSSFSASCLSENFKSAVIYFLPNCQPLWAKNMRNLRATVQNDLAILQGLKNVDKTSDNFPHLSRQIIKK